MLEIYDEYADSSVQELVQTANLIEIYAENAMNLIDDMEANEAFRNSYFTEATAEAEDAAKEAANKNIFAKIAETISKIFSKLAAVLSKGKTAAKAAKQSSDLKKIGPAVSKFPTVKLKIQDVWSYNKFVEDTVDKHIKKFDKKTTLNLFSKTFGTGRAIDGLTKNLSLMASELRTPSNKQFTINKSGVGKGVKTAAKGAAAAGAVVMGTNNSIIDRQSITGLGTLGNAMAGKMMSAGGPLQKVGQGAIHAAQDFAAWSATNPIVNGAILFIGTHGPLVMGTAAVIGGAFGIVALARIFSGCPKKIGTEQVTLQELYKRVSTLNPAKFPSEVAATAATANKYMQQTTTLNAFVQSADGSKGATAYANKVSSLLSAYTQYHQALIDFYLSIIVSILKAGGVQSSRKIYKPTEMVKSESAETETPDENVEENAESDDDLASDVDDYEESVDDMSDYMDLETFVENGLTDMAY